MTTSAEVTSSVVARRLEGKVALITGAASGIGEGCARVFVENGAKVMIADIQDAKGLKICEELGSTNASYVHCDVTKEEDVENAVNSTISKFGKLDIMFNNAGTADEAKQSILDNTLSDFKRIIDVNLVGVFLGTKHAARVMIPTNRGVIINTTSVSATIAGVATHAYTSSKHAILGLTRNTAVELGRYNIRVNCLSPYVVATPLTMDFFKTDEAGCHGVYSNLKCHPLYPKDIGEAALFLASNESRYVSGHNLVVDGGFIIVNPKFCMFEQS